jgi:hypothetical protein
MGVGVGGAVVCVGVGAILSSTVFGPYEYRKFDSTSVVTPDTRDETGAEVSEAAPSEPPEPSWPATLDRAEYDERLLELVDYEPPAPVPVRQGTSSGTSSAVTTYDTPPSPLKYSSSTNVTVAGESWPPAAPYPHGGAILPFERIVAYYGNFYSTRMGILGEYPRAEVLARLASTSAAWEAADPDTPVRQAIHYIAMVAQAEAGSDGMYRNVMPDEHIERAYDMTQEIDGIMFLDLQVGLSNLERELPQFRKYFTRPDVHLAVDPEFAMAPSGRAPGTVIGTFDAADINFAIEWLSEIVRDEKLPPKVLVVHRFTQNMVTNYQDITPTPEVQVVMHMDGWGPRDLKRSTYQRVIEPEPVQFAGLKIFYKNDLKPPSTGIFTPREALQLHPEPVYVQYQ